MEINDRIKAIARIKGITLKNLCIKIGMSESGFYTALKKNSFKKRTLEKIAQHFEMSYEKLMNYEIENEYPLVRSYEDLYRHKALLYKKLTEDIEKIEKELYELRLKRDLIFLDLV